jgi:ferredoxin-type protein NapG
MDRRAFFRSAIDKGSKPVIKAVDASIKKQATHWIRPPFAIDELDFILACTRCGDCIDACPHDVIFGLSARLGVKFAGTPALDLLNKGCHLCADWPCVNACTPNALTIPEYDTDTGLETAAEKSVAEKEDKAAQIPMPKLARASIDTSLCLPYSGPECGACISSCPVDGALTLDMVRPVIDQNLCTGCGLCRESCITEPKAINIASL